METILLYVYTILFLLWCFLLPFYYIVCFCTIIIVYCYIELSFGETNKQISDFDSDHLLISSIKYLTRVHTARATRLKPMTGEMNNIDHLVSMSRSAWKP